MKKYVVLIFALLTLSVCACGSKKGSDDHKDKLKQALQSAKDNKKENLPSPGKADDVEETVEEAVEGVFAEAFSNGVVENNGSLFVRVSDKVYYRVYGERELERTTINAQFTEKEEEVESELHCYDLKSGESENVCTVAANGKLFATTAGFCLAEPVGCSTVLLPMDGSVVRGYLKGKPEAVSDSGRMMVTIDYPEAGGNVSHILYRDGEEVTKITEGDDEALTVFGFAGENMIAMISHFDEACFDFMAYDPAGNAIALGSYEDSEDSYGYPEFDRMLSDGEDLYFTLAWYEGTGHFLSGWKVFHALTVADSLTEETVSGKGDEYVDTPPKIYLDDAGKLAISPHLKGDLDLSDMLSGDLIYYDTPKSFITIKKNYIYDDPYEYRYGGVIEESAVFDDQAFILRAEVGRDEAEDIGWRYAFDLFSLNYDRIVVSPDTADGVQEIKEVKSIDWIASSGWGDGDIAYEDLIGTWELYSFEVEGYYGLAEEEGGREELVFDADGSVRYIRKANDATEKDVIRNLYRVENGDSDSSLTFETKEGEDNPLHLVIMAKKEEKMDADWTYYYNDGTPGGYRGVYFLDKDNT